MAILYIGPKRNPDFSTDYYISPILTPAHLLADFPPVLMLCGEKDPFVDDTVIFGGRLREAKRAKRAELLAARSTSAPGPTSVPMSNTGSNSYSQTGMVGLRGEDARKAREETLMYEEEEDWVEMRILEGWGHGFLQMTSGLMLGQKVVNVIDDMADWIGDAFAAQGSTAPRRGSMETSQTAIAQPARNVTPLPTAAGTTPSSKYSDRRRSSPPRTITPSLAPTASDVPPPRHRPTATHPSNHRASSTSTTATITNSPPASAPMNLFSSTKSKLVNSEPPPMSSETETELERDRPLTFTVVRKSQKNTGTKRASFGSSSSNSSSHRRAPQQQQQQSGSPVDEVPVTAADLPQLPSPSSSSPPHPSAFDVNVPLTPVTGESSSFAATLGFGGPGSAILTPSVTSDAASKPLSPKIGSSGAGGTTLLSQGELMRRRRMEAVFGMGESEDASAFDDEAGSVSAPASATSTRSPSPVAMRHSRHGHEDSHGPGRPWNTPTLSIDSIDKNANGV